jgi:hypothetical protein
MIWQAHVYLQEAPNATLLRDLGIIALDGDAEVGSRVYFVVDSNTKVGMIENLATSTVPPIVHISLPRQ